MNRETAQLLNDQYGVITRRQALACGITRNALRHKLRRDGPWRKILPGVYVTETGTVTPVQREMAALLHAGPGAIITGAAAVRRHHLTCAGLGEIDVLVPVKSRVQSTGFVRIQHTTRMPDAGSAWSTRSLRFAPLPRAIADAARQMKSFDEVQALVCEAMQRGGSRCTFEDLITELGAGPKAGSRLFREALVEITAGIRSVAEKDLKQVIDRSGTEKPMYNPRLYLIDGSTFTFLAMPDAWWQRAGVAAEVDSLQYHFRARDYEETTARHNRMEAAGIRLLHLLPGSIRRERESIITDLKKAIEAGTRNPPLPVIAVPATVKDPEAWLLQRSRSRSFARLSAL
ncbi:MAG: type IV toxin-antitoxin system AbiEi family antitoxin domain-containing protein [Nocardiopsaceae bacterium]|nr:type IV toxin-antitoxin system AbiEi family antitoxin domain-containing protein [Nocardiopsaceae bacterium]